MAVTTTATTVEITHPKNPNTKVSILNFGATVLSWQVNGVDKLWLSKTSKLDGTRGVRGGIPLVFPRFGPPGKHAPTDNLPQHGFVRTSNWEFLGQVNETTVQYGLGPENISEEYRKNWPYDFTLVFTVGLGEETLDLKFDVTNTGDKNFDFNVLFHTYFEVPAVEDVTVAGVHGLGYWNKVTTSNVDKDEEKEITFSDTTDRVYANSPSSLAIKSKGTTIYSIEAKNVDDVVVWNPWASGAKTMTDFDDDRYHTMVCVENGSVAKFQDLKPGAKWEGEITLKAHI